LQKNRKKTGRQVGDSLAALGVSILIRIIRTLDYPRASAFGKHFGRLAYHLFSRYRRRSLENLARVFPEEKTPGQRKEIGRIFFENFLRNASELVPYGHLPESRKREYVSIVGKENLDDALALGRGVISLSAHVGNFLILMSRLALEGYPVDLVLKKMRNERVEDRMQSLRKELGYNSIYVTPRIHSVRASLTSLKNNHVLVMLGDQRPRQAWINVTFFGLPAKAAAGPVSLALSTGAPVVPMFMVRSQEGIHHTLFIDDPLEMVCTGSKENDIQVNVQKYTDVIQSYVERYPAQWMWGHNRWA
jgi:KDO2-lipid IV(A) lauroyltransferase